MEVLDAIENRFSCRKYTGEPVGADDVRKLIEAGLHAPTANNAQQFAIRAVSNKELLDEVEAKGFGALSPEMQERFNVRGGKLLYDVPLILFVFIAESEHPEMVSADCGIIVENIALAATGLGLGSCICAMARYAMDAEMLKKLQCPDGYKFGLCVLLGHPAETKDAHPIDPALAQYLS